LPYSPIDMYTSSRWASGNESKSSVVYCKTQNY